MAFDDIINEPWFIGTVAGVGALILILIVVIIILCCLWFRKKKQLDEKRPDGEHHDRERDSGTTTPSSYQEMTEAQNWTMVQQNGVASVPGQGFNQYNAGSSLVGMNEEMRPNGGPSSRTSSHKQTYYKTGIGKTLEQNQNIDAFERKISNASESSRVAYRGGVYSSGHFERDSDVRESARSNQSFQKPRLANIQVSQSKQSESSVNTSYPANNRVYLPERSDSTRSTRTSFYKKTNYNQPYRIPEEDYSGIQMSSEEERYSWRAPAQTQTSARQAHESLHRLSDGKVKNLTERFQTTEVSTAGETAVTSRSAMENELREQIAGRRNYQKSEGVPISPHRGSRGYQYPQTDLGDASANWQGKSGKGTIETRVKRIKKVGAISVFPD
ncbi:uncharacterized protein LOC116300322 [Actinia tenebrosa]|uniref:Uncharacterized protein LOC116300322 n=1 Tax=Actinia tenebrosa TaxID=6105 RepID=A0A6P8I8Y5_ACTTE|nr:uncharacterized protein LOC116300322 [Actinia tenebrosa]XP_031565030.1 uncharacterized protein LOC116300322 [Actinia tenebrosa]